MYATCFWQLFRQHLLGTCSSTQKNIGNHIYVNITMNSSCVTGEFDETSLHLLSITLLHLLYEDCYM